MSTLVKVLMLLAGLWLLVAIAGFGIGPVEFAVLVVALVGGLALIGNSERRKNAHTD